MFGANQQGDEAMKYRIQRKQDFGPMGFWIGGEWVRRGFVVTSGGANVMPGATWFRSIAEAMDAIAVLEKTGNGPAFWTELRNKKAAA
jgi:hypothetical protein